MAWIKKVYLYLVSLVSLIILIIAGIILINMGLKAWVFTEADNANYYEPMLVCSEVSEEEKATMSSRDPNCDDPNYEQRMRDEEAKRRSAQRQSSTAQALAMIIVATPVFLYHWKLARKEA